MHTSTMCCTRGSCRSSSSPGSEIDNHSLCTLWCLKGHCRAICATSTIQIRAVERCSLTSAARGVMHRLITGGVRDRMARLQACIKHFCNEVLIGAFSPQSFRCGALRTSRVTPTAYRQPFLLANHQNQVSENTYSLQEQKGTSYRFLCMYSMHQTQVVML